MAGGALAELETGLTYGGFDYAKAGIAGAIKTSLVKISKAIQQENGRTLKVAVEQGKHFKAARDVFDADSGRASQFGRWVEQECACGHRTAQRYMKIAEVFGAVDDKLLPFFTLRSALALCGDDVMQEQIDQVLKTVDKERIVFDTPHVKLLLNGPNGESPKPEFDAEKDLSKPAIKMLEDSGIKAPVAVLKKLASYQKPAQAELVESVVDGVQTLSQAVETGEIPHPSAEEWMSIALKKVNAYATSVRKAVDAMPTKVPALQKVADTISEQLKALLSTIRSCKPHAICPSCNGEGCKDCHKAGWVTRERHEQLVGKPTEEEEAPAAAE